MSGVMESPVSRSYVPRVAFRLRSPTTFVLQADQLTPDKIAGMSQPHVSELITILPAFHGETSVRYSKTSLCSNPHRCVNTCFVNPVKALDDNSARINETPLSVVSVRLVIPLPPVNTCCSNIPGFHSQ